MLSALAIVIGQRHHRVCGTLAQVLWGNLTGLSILLLPPRTTHVGDQIAAVVPTEVLLRGRVELHVALRNEDGRHGIQQRGFT